MALAHHWLTGMRGGERVLQEIAAIVGPVPIYTLLARHERLTPELLAHEIRVSFLQRIPLVRRRHRWALPLMPRAAARMDLTAYDVVICSDAGLAKAMRWRPEALCICYCHSPPRYVWDLYDQYRREAGRIGGLLLAATAGRIRERDHAAAQRVAVFVANSHFVAERIRRHYGRKAVVIYPAVRLADVAADSPPEDFYLVVCELVGYKRVDLAVQACSRLGRRLIVIGEGPQLRRLRKLAGPTVRFLGFRDDATVRDHMRRCRALLFCGEDDFGLTPVETQSFGRPVIAFGRGGACETVLDGRTGLWFRDQTVESLIEAMKRFEEGSPRLWVPQAIREHARQFDAALFRARFRRLLDWCLERYERGGVAAVRRAADRLDAEAFLEIP